jgi:hypothetical protein
MAGQLWFWEREVVKTADETLYQITVTVGLQEELSNPITAVSTFMVSQKK